MSGYRDLENRLRDKQVIVLDGAVGTQLQAMKVPMSSHAWAAEALYSHPFTVRRMHENYIAAGCDVITTNTYASARHNLVPLGQGDVVGMDLVEVAPPYDQSGITTMLSAQLLMNFIGFVFEARRQAR